MAAKSDKVYTMKIELKGQPRILTIRVTGKGLDIMLTDPQGNMIEYFKQDGVNVSVSGPGAVLKSRKAG